MYNSNLKQTMKQWQRLCASVQSDYGYATEGHEFINPIVGSFYKEEVT